VDSAHEKQQAGMDTHKRFRLPGVGRRRKVQIQLESIATVQIELIRREGILVRGGIAIGALGKRWGLVYGNALVRAYELEEQATHPRVLLHPELVEVLRRLSGQLTLLATASYCSGGVSRQFRKFLFLAK
jgi:hypothetical protein